MPRILFVNLAGTMGGAERSLLLAVEHLCSHFQTGVACPGGSPLWIELTSIRTERYSLPGAPSCTYRSLRGIAYLLRASFRMIRIVLRANPDIVHANSFYAGAVSLPAAIVTRRKLIVHARDLADFGFLSRLYNWFCRKVIAVSHSVRSELVEQGINSERIEVIYNGVDEGSFDRPEQGGVSCISRDPDEQRAFVFGHVGQFVPWKKQTVFLEAASRVASVLSDVRFVLVGDDICGRDTAYKHSVLFHAANLDLSERVSFPGWEENMREVWGQINCLVHTADREPFGRVIVEAMAHKIPVIAVGACGPGEIIEDDKTGLLVQKDDIEELSETMIRIVRDRDFADKLANAGYEHVIANFTADKTAEQIQGVYEDALAV